MNWNPLPALEFLTIVRVRPWRPVSAEALAGSQAFYPAVGLLLGCALLVTDRALASLLPVGPRSAVLVGLLALLTRGLHLDGLADMFDGLLGGRDPARRLDIMRDPRIGSFGAVALIVVLLTKWSALAALAAPVRSPALLLFPTLGRFGMVAVTAAVPYARPQGAGVGYHQAARGTPLLVAAASALVVSVVAFAAAGILLAIVAVAAALAVGWWAQRRVGGATGDVYGAACVLTEVAVLLAITMAQSKGWLDPWLVSV